MWHAAAHARGVSEAIATQGAGSLLPLEIASPIAPVERR
jgi:hypothetical protein